MVVGDMILGHKMPKEIVVQTAPFICNIKVKTSMKHFFNDNT